MARIFITGSSDGLGSLVAQALVKQGHQVVLHARDAQRAKDAAAACPGSEKVLVADLSDATETKQLADEVNKLGPLDCIVHNAGIYRGPGGSETIDRNADNVPALVQVNSFAPHILTALVNKPKRLVYVASELYTKGDPASLADISWQARRDADWSAYNTYCDSKLHLVMYAQAVARRWPDVRTASMCPGWIATKLGGAGATGDAEVAVQTYLKLVVGEVPATGKFWVSSEQRPIKKEALDVAAQDRVLGSFEKLTGVPFPS